MGQILSDDRQSYWAHLVSDILWKDDLVDYSDEDAAVRIAKKAVATFVQENDRLDKHVREKISKLKRSVAESSPEWEILYKKYFEEELVRKGRG